MHVLGRAAAPFLFILTCAGVYLMAQQSADPHSRIEKLTPVTDAMLQSPPPEDWLHWRRTLDSWGYSPLDQITPQNVTRLKPVWSFSTGETPQSVMVMVAAGAVAAVRSVVAPRMMVVNGRMASSPFAGRRSWRRGGWCALVTRQRVRRMRRAGWRVPAPLR